MKIRTIPLALLATAATLLAGCPKQPPPGVLVKNLIGPIFPIL
jgi:hypothetical protein